MAYWPAPPNNTNSWTDGIAQAYGAFAEPIYDARTKTTFIRVWAEYSSFSGMTTTDIAYYAVQNGQLKAVTPSMPSLMLYTGYLI